MGEVYTAQLQADGSLLDSGSTYDTPSAWAGHVAGNERNGWRDVSARGRPLEDFRSQLRGTLESPEVPRKAIGSAKDTTEGKQIGREIGAETGEVEPPTTPSELQGGEPQTIGERLLDRLIKLSPDEFERLLVDFFTARGFSNARPTGRSGDDGIDGEFEMPLLKVKAAFQAKRFQRGNKVGIDPVQRLQGSLGNKYQRGVFVTTSEFTVPAKGWVEETNAPLVLIDGHELVDQMIELGLGVTRVPVVETHLDEDFFDGLAGGGG